MTFIEEYYNKIKNKEVEVSHKVAVVYKKLVYEISYPTEVTYYDEIAEEYETRTYIFDEKKAKRPIEFIERFCKHSKGKWAGHPVILELWQKALVEAMYGFVDKDTGLRKYKKVILFIGRKNGKSTLASALGLYHMVGAGEGGAECYSVAVKKDQAKIVWEEARRMVKKSPALRKRIKGLVNGLFYDAKDSYFKALASASDSLDGLNAYFVSADETHAWKDKNLMDVMYDSMSAREEPMLFETSTMGTIREGVFDNEYEYLSKIIDGYENKEGGIVDDTVLPIIYELDKKEYWTDEKKWFQANPGLITIKRIDDIRTKVNRAKNNPSELTNLLCKDFNVRMNSEEKWLTFDIVNNTETFDMEEIRDCYAVGGVDLSATTDLTCATVIVEKGKKKYVLQQYFIPEANLENKIKEDKIPYDIWERRKLITLCEGARVNYSDVTAWFRSLYEEYDLHILWVGYDPWNTQYWLEEMITNGFDMVEVRQGAKTLSNPMKQLEADLIQKNINYNNNPILKWCLGNTAIKRDDNDNIRPVKRKTTKTKNRWCGITYNCLLRADGKIYRLQQYLGGIVMKKEKRSLYEVIFGNKKQHESKGEKTYLKMLNGFTPTYSAVGKSYCDFITVKTCINTIATHGAKMLPCHIQSYDGKIKFINGEINYILSKQPNPFMNTYNFLYKVIATLYKENNAFIFIHTTDGMIDGLYPIEAGCYELLQDSTGEIYLQFKFVNGQYYTLPYSDIIHLRRFYDSHEIYGDTNISLAKPVEVANTAMQGIDNAIKTSSYLRGILKFTQSMLKQSDLNKFKDAFVKDFMTIENESGIAVLDQRAEFQEVNTSPVTLTKDQLSYTKENIYDYFGISENIIRSTFSADEWNAFFESVIEPIAMQMSNEFTNKIFNKEAIRSGHQIIFNVDRIKYAKTDTKIKLLKELAILGLYTVDEAREILDMSPIGGEEGSKRIQTLNVVNSEIADEYQLGESEAGNDKE